jgi:hypothetical protein
VRRKSFKLELCIILWLTFLLTNGRIHAQNPVFTAVVSANQVVQNTVFEIRFELKNADGENFEPPSFGHFRVVGGPSTSSSVMIVNGEMSRSESWSYSLLATEEGTFTIGPASVAAGRKVLSTRPLNIQVLKAKSSSGTGITTTGKEKVLLIAEVDSSTYYPGQQIILRYKLLFNQNVQGVTVLSEDDYADFFVQNFSNFNNQSEIETVNGVSYTSRVIKEIAMFAHQSGDYTIDPMVMDVGVEAPFPERRGFFTMRNIDNIKVSSAARTIHIKSLPNNAPVSFSGAVGKYSLRSSSSPAEITTDDAFTMTLEIRGDGDAKRWDPPSPAVDGDFEMYDPRIVNDKTAEENDRIVHMRTIEYQMIPRDTGSYHVFIPLTFFNPSTGKYETIASDTIHLHVSKGTDKGRPSIVAQETETPREIKKVRNITTDDRFWLSIPHLLLFGFVVSGTCWGMWLSYKKRKEDRISPAEKIRLLAASQSRLQLNALESSGSSLSSKEFFERATEIYYRYLSDKLMIPAADLDLTKLSGYLDRYIQSETTKEQVIKFFDQCLSVRYGGIPGGMTREEMLAEVRMIIDLIENDK